MKNIFRSWWKSIQKQRLFRSKKWAWKYKFLGVHDNQDLLDYVLLTANKVANNEKVPIRIISTEELNKDYIKVENHCVGRFLYLKDYSEIRGVFPRIELDNSKDNVWVLIHELGHYFRYKRRKKQSEPVADSYTIEFFKKYLPPFFLWVFQIDISVRIGSDKFRTYTDYEAFEHYQSCKEFLKNLKTNPI